MFGDEYNPRSGLFKRGIKLSRKELKYYLKYLGTELAEKCRVEWLEENLGRILQHFQTREFGTISGFIRGRPDAENLEKHFQLEMDLKDLGYGYIPIVGKWDGIPERSFFVPNASAEDMVDLGRKYGQEAVIWGEKGLAYLIDPASGNPIAEWRQFKVMKIDDAYDDFSASRWKKIKDVEGKVIKVEPIRPWRYEELRTGDVVYMEPSDCLYGLRGLFWPPSCLFKFVGMQGPDYAFTKISTDNRIPEGKYGLFAKKLQEGMSIIHMPPRWVRNCFVLMRGD